MAKNLEGPIGAGSTAKICGIYTGRDQNNMRVLIDAKLACEGLKLVALRQQANNVITADTPSIFKIIGMHRTGDMAFQPCFI